jgi:TRAP-type C4-dicarboxylate transport system permease small subunit
MVQRISGAFGRLYDGLAVAAALTLLGMVIIVTADIVLRNALNSGFVWANEVSEYALYLITLLTAPWLLRRGQHIRVDLLLTVLPRKAAWLVEAVGDVLGFAVCLVMLRLGWLMAFEAFRLGSITIKNLVFPEWWLLVPVPVTFALLAIEFIFRFHRLVQSRERREEATSVA